MRNQIRDPSLSQLHTFDLAQLIFRLFSSNAVDGETALGVVDKSEVLPGFLDGNHIHEPCGKRDIGSDLAVDFDEALHNDGLGFAAVEGIF